MAARPPHGPALSAGSLRATLVTYLLILVLVLVPFWFLLQPYLLSLATGAVLGVICYPLYLRLRRRLPATAAGMLVTLGVLVLVLVPVSLLAIGAIRQGATAIASLAEDGAPTVASMVGAARLRLPFLDAIANPEELETALRGGLASASATASGVAFGQIRGLPTAVIQILVAVLATYFALVDGERLVSWVGDKLPLSLHIRELLSGSFRSATRAVVLASIAAAGAQSTLILAAFWALGVPSALLAAGLTFVLGWVPGLPMVVWVVATAFLYQQGSIPRAAIMVGVGLVVGIVDNLVRAVVLRGQEAIHPMVSFIAILGGIVLFGVTGVFIGPLIACMAIAVLEIWPAVAAHCGIAVSGAGQEVPDVPMLDADGVVVPPSPPTP